MTSRAIVASTLFLWLTICIALPRSHAYFRHVQSNQASEVLALLSEDPAQPASPALVQETPGGPTGTPAGLENHLFVRTRTSSSSASPPLYKLHSAYLI